MVLVHKILFQFLLLLKTVKLNYFFILRTIIGVIVIHIQITLKKWIFLLIASNNKIISYSFNNNGSIFLFNQ